VEGQILVSRWDDERIGTKECFKWLTNWADRPTHTIAEIFKLYEQKSYLHTPLTTRTA